MTGAVYEDPQDGPTVLHFAVPMTAAGVLIDPIWQVLGMRGTGSHDILLEDVFIPDAAVSGKRPPGKWSPLFQVISMIAFSLIYSVYRGVAEAARDLAVKQAGLRRVDGHVRHLVGGMENELAIAQLALADMIAAAASNDPGFQTTNRVFLSAALSSRARYLPPSISRCRRPVGQRFIVGSIWSDCFATRRARAITRYRKVRSASWRRELPWARIQTER